MSPDEYLKIIHPGLKSEVNVAADGTVLPKPPEGWDWKRGPDGKPLIDPDTHQGEYYKVKEGKPYDTAIKEATKETMSKVHDQFVASNVGTAVRDAMKQVDKPGVVGVGSPVIRYISGAIGGMPANKFDSNMDTIKSNVVIQTLAQMRNSSPSGGALGNVTDFENKMLAGVISPLSTYTDAASIKKGLIRIQAAMEILALDDFGKKTDPAGAPAKFQAALDKRIAELGNEYAPTTETRRPNVKRIE
jgi:hypothetical protein